MPDTQGQPRDFQEQQKRQPGAWVLGPGRALARSCPWAQALAASFVIPGDPEAAPGSLAYERGSQVANLENRSGVDFVERTTKGNKIDMAMYLVCMCL